VGTDQFIAVLAEKQITDLRTSLHTVDFFHLKSIPESDTPICRAATTDE
jgi:hypothetical protein